WQCRELARHTVRVQHVVDVAFPDTGTGETRSEPIRLTELESQARGRQLELGVARSLGPQSEHALLFLAESAACARAELGQDGAIVVRSAIDRAASLSGARVASADLLVDDLEVPRVVDEAASCICFRIDARPE